MTSALHILGHILTACITLAIGMGFSLFGPSSRVVEIDSDAILRAFVEDMGDVSERELETRSLSFLNTMQSVLERYATQNGVVVVEAKLAVAGAQDISDEAYRQALFMMPAALAEAGE